MSEGTDESLYLPDFCTSRAALANVLIVELTALILTLAHENVGVGSGRICPVPPFFYCGSASPGPACCVGCGYP